MLGLQEQAKQAHVTSLPMHTQTPLCISSKLPVLPTLHTPPSLPTPSALCLMDTPITLPAQPTSHRVHTPLTPPTRPTLHTWLTPPTLYTPLKQLKLRRTTYTVHIAQTAHTA